ncbi:unnamed protein product [Brassica rapa]|uniref:Uncharacterized protein n=1 Tax=Brassica campestris TaxID=3711 RepID=A0A8D9CUT6_BRACM|nr:unnamed protein product [Brassica rapa]
MLSPRTNVLICVLMDSHRRPPQTSCVHGRPVCADGQPRTSCVCWRTPTDVLFVLNRQPTWAKITQTVHGKGQHAESKDQRADMCTDGQPRMSCVHTRTHMDSHRRPVCADGEPRTTTDPTWAKITQTVQGKGHRADSKDQSADMCTDGQPRMSCVC